MVLCWVMSNDDGDQRLAHQKNPNEEVSLDILKSLGVDYWNVNGTEDPKLEEIKKNHGYSYTDVICVSPDTLPDYEQKIKLFFTEHLHDDDEIRFCLEGSGYFDVRSSTDQDWIRIHVEKNDMISLPAGIYHRFTLDTNNYIKAMRLFVGEPVWKAHDRPADGREARRAYVSKFVAQK
mmetsp:Transcript_135118/g.200973  ORF Transcript_135118/g.200973 Transcript_135118/m.200973 type:complete len:178 (-) Transcript_135118:44-577(-)|eukprot:CAMPEP_0117055324 /NCGR_PEP_ID=MMETSP0472-20121206/38351_1 /TAXON_ID=693140 ORGANISM="Tiarina fusus, Strain LIS" /NCGR_SAMPLE_ID=MMETSP0472 /ASSEMBLY_ACC=CAM_ASM_000603 /LENGTH=177 /DNA_ID=CAMNT_0004771273 /DNA_START=6 /DNA_END=539 /DNA_ORIENTATION=+